MNGLEELILLENIHLPAIIVDLAVDKEDARVLWLGYLAVVCIAIYGISCYRTYKKNEEQRKIEEGTIIWSEYYHKKWQRESLEAASKELDY